MVNLGQAQVVHAGGHLQPRRFQPKLLLAGHGALQPCTTAPASEPHHVTKDNVLGQCRGTASMCSASWGEPLLCAVPQSECCANASLSCAPHMPAADWCRRVGLTDDWCRRQGPPCSCGGQGSASWHPPQTQWAAGKPTPSCQCSRGCWASWRGWPGIQTKTHVGALVLSAMLDAAPGIPSTYAGTSWHPTQRAAQAPNPREADTMECADACLPHAARRPG